MFFQGPENYIILPMSAVRYLKRSLSSGVWIPTKSSHAVGQLIGEKAFASELQ